MTPESGRPEADRGPPAWPTKRCGIDEALKWGHRFDMSASTVRIAAIQATPVILDAEATVSKALHLLAKAAGDGVKLAVFPETFIPLYPSGVWAHAAARFGGFDEMWERLWANSVDVPGPHIDRFIEACAEHGIYCVLGVNERESARPGSLYNTMVLLGPEGMLWKHRKLMPTMHERLTWPPWPPSSSARTASPSRARTTSSAEAPPSNPLPPPPDALSLNVGF